VRGLRLLQLVVQRLYGALDILYLLNEAVLRMVFAQLDALPVGPGLQPRLSHLERPGLVLNGLLEQEEVLLHVEQLLLHLLQVQLDPVLCLGHLLRAPIKGVVGVAPEVPHGGGHRVNHALGIAAQLGELRPLRLGAAETDMKGLR